MAVPGTEEEFFTARSVAGRVAIVTDSTASLPADESCRSLVAVVPLRLLAGGQVVPVERVRTRAAAAGRLTELAAGFSGGQPVDVAVEHIAAAGQAADLAGRLAKVIPQVRRRYQVAAGLAIRAHTGPWMLAVTVAPQPAVG